MEQWIRDRFHVSESDEAVWIAENGNETMSPISHLASMFEGVATTYEAFAAKVDPPMENPAEQGVTWGNHVRSWHDAGVFD